MWLISTSVHNATNPHNVQYANKRTHGEESAIHPLLYTWAHRRRWSAIVAVTDWEREHTSPPSWSQIRMAMGSSGFELAIGWTLYCCATQEPNNCFLHDVFSVKIFVYDACIKETCKTLFYQATFWNMLQIIPSLWKCIACLQSLSIWTTQNILLQLLYSYLQLEFSELHKKQDISAVFSNH